MAHPPSISAAVRRHAAHKAHGGPINECATCNPKEESDLLDDAPDLFNDDLEYSDDEAQPAADPKRARLDAIFKGRK